MAIFAFSCNYAPGASSDTPLVEIIKKILGRDPTTLEMSVARRLFDESYAHVASDIKTQVLSTVQCIHCCLSCLLCSVHNIMPHTIFLMPSSILWIEYPNRFTQQCVHCAVGSSHSSVCTVQWAAHTAVFALAAHTPVCVLYSGQLTQQCLHWQLTEQCVDIIDIQVGSWAYVSFRGKD